MIYFKSLSYPESEITHPRAMITTDPTQPIVDPQTDDVLDGIVVPLTADNFAIVADITDKIVHRIANTQRLSSIWPILFISNGSVWMVDRFDDDPSSNIACHYSTVNIMLSAEQFEKLVDDVIKWREISMIYLRAPKDEGIYHDSMITTSKNATSDGCESASTYTFEITNRNVIKYDPNVSDDFKAQVNDMLSQGIDPVVMVDAENNMCHFATTDAKGADLEIFSAKIDPNTFPNGASDLAAQFSI